ncbi:MAG: DUF370 domain-containing protein [Candidatus Acetothermia bacterium]|nr:DUF370 domain-containing protein [Candidatus Acetothermia bacterium]MDH7505029.1 DUF370 domain-containing protein [Candidatus Acetothermia bacterium]
MSRELIALGPQSLVLRDRVVLIARPDTVPLQRLIRRYEGEGRLIDLTQGRGARAAVITDAGFIILSPLRPKTIAERFLEE